MRKATSQCSQMTDHLVSCLPCIKLCHLSLNARAGRWKLESKSVHTQPPSQHLSLQVPRYAMLDVTVAGNPCEELSNTTFVRAERDQSDSG